MAKTRRQLLSRKAAVGVAGRRLEQETARRRASEVALRLNEQRHRLLQRESRRWKEKVRALSHELLSAREEERKKISRELHDVVAQSLAAINARLATLQVEAAAKTGNLGQGLASTQELVGKSIELIHRFARELRPTELDDLGLIRALHAYMIGLRRKTGMPVSLTATATVERLETAVQTVLYRVAQEALTNVVRHAEASRADVTIQRLRGHVLLKVSDNGRGFPARSAMSGRKTGRLGLLGMAERVELIGGKLTIKSTPGKGVIILAKVPLQASGTRRRRNRLE